MRYLLSLFCLCFGCGVALAEVQTDSVDYQDGDVHLQGFFAWDTALAGKSLPGVLVVHQWMGLTDYEKRRCEQLAELGYVAFALDIYGKGERPGDVAAAREMSGRYKQDRELYRRRLKVGLEQLKKHAAVDKERVAAIGYCFGGTGVLELARSGADFDGAVSFHGGLDSPSPEDGKNIKAKLLICHGADDPFVPKEDIQGLVEELNAADVNWQMNVYSNAVHSFTQPMAGNDPSRGAAYNPQADRRSWEAMKMFFNELFQSSE